MGRLKNRRISRRQVRQAVFSWLLPVLLALTILFGIHSRVKADPAPTSDQLAQYLQSNQLGVFTQDQDGYVQIFYQYQSQDVQITSSGYNHVSAVGSNEYVAWEGLTDGGQIFLYDILTDALTQITSSGTNEFPAIYKNTVVWQAWDGQYWQIDYYNGVTVQQITNDQDSSVRASINGQQIIYAEQLAPDDWEAQSYDISTGQTQTIREGDTTSTAYPQFSSDGSITTAFIPS